MSRYLNPSKVALLILIQLYIEKRVPPKATLPLLSFLTSRIQPPHEAPQVSGLDPKNYSFTTLKDLQLLLAQHETLDSGLQVSPSVPAISDPLNLYSCYVSLLWQLNTLNNFVDYLKNLEHFFESYQGKSIPLAKPSLLGVFVRRCILEYERLGFEDVVSLWLNYKSFRAPTYHTSVALGTCEKSKASEAEWDYSYMCSPTGTILGAKLDDDTRRASMNPRNTSQDLDKLLNFQITQIQSQSELDIPTLLC